MQGFGFVSFTHGVEKYQALYKHRLVHGLPCLDGPITMSDMSCVRIRMAVCRAILSCQEGIIVAEECHFGIISHPDLFSFKLMADNSKNVDMTKITTFTFVDGVLNCEPLIEVFNTAIEVVTVVEHQIDCVDVIEFVIDEPTIMMPVNMPVPSRPMVGFDVQERTYEIAVEEHGRVNNFTTVLVDGDVDVTYVQMPLSRYVALDHKIYSIVEGHCALTCEGGMFRVRDDVSGYYVDKEKIYSDELDEYVPFVVRSQSAISGNKVQVTVRNVSTYTLLVEGEYVRDVSMKLFAMKFALKCKQMLQDFIEGLRKLPRTLLVDYNLGVLLLAIPGYRMPSRELINQVALMVDKRWMCSDGYTSIMEGWKPYHKWENWNNIVRRLYKKKKVFRTPLSVFDGKQFDYNSCDLTSAEERRIWTEHSMSYDGSASYKEYLKMCADAYEYEVDCANQDKKDELKFLFRQFTEKEKIRCCC